MKEWNFSDLQETKSHIYRISTDGENNRTYKGFFEAFEMLLYYKQN